MSVWDQGRQPSGFQPQETEFDKILRGHPDVKTRSTAEQVKADYEEALAANQAHLDGLENIKSLDAFAMGHKELCDTKANGELLLNQANTMFGKRAHTVEHFEAAYQYLRTETDFLKIDKTVEAAKQREAAKQHFEAETARTAERAFNPNVDYDSMPLEEIRQRAAETFQDEQATGNRGGYDIG